jgi:hypothetical protein
MVSTGRAWAFTRYDSDYISQERAAIGARTEQPSANALKRVSALAVGRQG